MDSSESCETCGLSVMDCVGHFGYVDLALPTFHVGYLSQCHQVMQTICKVILEAFENVKNQNFSLFFLPSARFKHEYVNYKFLKGL